MKLTELFGLTWRTSWSYTSPFFNPAATKKTSSKLSSPSTTFDKAFFQLSHRSSFIFLLVGDNNVALAWKNLGENLISGYYEITSDRHVFSVFLDYCASPLTSMNDDLCRFWGHFWQACFLISFRLTRNPRTSFSSVSWCRSDTIWQPNIKPGSFLYNYWKALNDAGFEIAMANPTLLSHKGELQSLAKVKGSKR